MEEIVEVDEKGRIVIPVSIRVTFGIEKGAKLVLETRGTEIVITRINTQPGEGKPEELKSFLENTPIF